MSSILAPIGAGLQIGGQIGAGISARAAANRNAQLAEVEAGAIRRDGVSEVARLRDEARRIAGEAIAAQGASGIALGTGSALDVLRENAIEAELDQMTVRQNAEARARAREIEAANSRAEGRAAFFQAILGAAASAVQAGSAGAFGAIRPTTGRSTTSGGTGASSGVMNLGSRTYGMRTVR